MRPLRKILGGIISRALIGPVTKDATLTISDRNPILRKMFGLGDDIDGLTSPYSQIPIIYASIRAVEKVMAQTPWKILKGERETDERDPMFRLWAAPNLQQSPDDVRTAIGSNLQLRGNAFLVKSEEINGGLPIALYAWPSTYFKAKYNDAGQWIGWMLKRGKAAAQFLPIDRVIHIPTFNPSDELMGLAPLDVLKQSYSALWEAVVFNRKFFKNDGTPPIVYTVPKDVPFNEHDREQFLNELKARRGEKGAHTAQLLEGGVIVTPIGFTQKDMQFLELIQHFSEDALMVFGVTKTQVSKYEDVNYATALSQDKVFITNTCLPLMRKVESKVNSQWLSALGYALKFDERANQALTYISGEEATKISTLVGGGPLITVNDGRKLLGLEPVPWGDEPPGTPDQLPSFPAPAPVSRATPAEPVTDKVLEEEMAKARRATTWHTLNAKISPQVKKAEFELRKYFHAIEQRAIAMATSKSKDPELAKKLDQQDVDMLFDDAKLERIVEKHLRASLALGAGTLDVAINLENPEVLQYLGSRVQYVKGVNEDARQKLRETITRVLQDAMDQQMTEELRTLAIRDALKQDFSALKGRARSIARTEVHSAFADGRWQGAQELNPKSIEWISSRDMLVRDSHRKLDGKRVPFGEKFSQWGFNGKHPLDSEAGPAQVINCRCTFRLEF